MPEFEPRIIAFLCNWCTYTGADLAGTARIQYPPNIRVIRLMCSGALDPVYVLKALLEGADGVLIGGCHPGDCHYMSGNYKARRRVAILQRDPASRWASTRTACGCAGSAPARAACLPIRSAEMVDALRAKGPNPLRVEWAV